MKTINRQGARRLAGLFSLLVFPASFYYFSPYVCLMGASLGIVTGSVLLFALLFLSSLVVGRLFCAWVCPAGAIQDLAATGRAKPFPKHYRFLKYLVWAPWFGLLILLFLRHGLPLSVRPAYATEYGLSTTTAPALVIYLVVALAFFAIAALAGRRAACHTICWMAAFMILGRELSTRARLPALRLAANRDTCRSCGACDRACPMGLEVGAAVRRGRMESADCILCGECVDHCPSKSLGFVWDRPRAGI
jgi:polyferredoxin